MKIIEDVLHAEIYGHSGRLSFYPVMIVGKFHYRRKWWDVQGDLCLLHLPDGRRY